MLYGEKDGEKVLVPLQAVQVKSELRGPTAITDVELTYFNPSENPLECTYMFPLDKKTILSKFEATIDGKTIHTKVTEKEAAKERYAGSLLRLRCPGTQA